MSRHNAYLVAYLFTISRCMIDDKTTYEEAARIILWTGAHEREDRKINAVYMHANKKKTIL